MLLPSLLIIDSPRKGIGRTETADQKLAEEVYRRLKPWVSPSKGEQLITADNDAELGGEKDVSLIRLPEKDSAVPGVPNMGVGTRPRSKSSKNPTMMSSKA
ncbi:hypothetical protein [Amycolatopsis sp. YIM 10]|uniref:hypothetical protein n=1 Tax=Amycolatopsis sp. YIM 10 TaxID=2653857 RepID=UPI0012907AF8|nr:hypothetical protein [Amycolatopsis sp. YIM 10]QFU86614.1 hypothetical protein YIM_07015 [Amycolatopsis sp. YIM 10]